MRPNCLFFKISKDFGFAKQFFTIKINLKIDSFQSKLTCEAKIAILVGFLVSFKKLWCCVSGRGKQKFDFIKRVDKSRIITVRDLKS